MDKFAKIAANGIKGKFDKLVFPSPIEKETNIINLDDVQNHKAYIYKEKISTKEELDNELKCKRDYYKSFLQDLAPELENHRKTVELKNFDWWLEGSKQKEQIEIPHYSGPLGSHTAFYETKFSVQEINSDKACFISFKGADYKAKIFINGVFVGMHEGFFSPFEFDITKYIVVGDNTLTVQLENDYIMMGSIDENGNSYCGDKIYAATGPGYDDPKRGWHHCPPGMGLYNKVFIEFRDRVFVNDIFARNKNEDIVEIWTEIYNCDYNPKKVYLSLSLYGQNFNETVFENKVIEPKTGKEIGLGDTFTKVISKRNGTIDAQLDLLSVKGKNLYKISIPAQKLKKWQLDCPYLYQIQLKLLDENKVVKDTYKCQFGVRTFTQDIKNTPKGMFYLNGEKIKLRGANTMGFEQQDVMKGDINQLIDDILLAKICNMNFLRLTQRPVQDEIYEYCDKLGLMTQTDLPLFGCLRRSQFCEAVRQAEEMERLIRNHPCNVIISYINEPFPNAFNLPNANLERDELESFFDACDIVVKLNNPERVIKHVDGDYDPPSKLMPDNHCYPMWYNGHGIDIGKLHKGYWMQVKPDWYYGCGEFGTEGLEEESVMRKYYPTDWLPNKNDDQSNWKVSSIVNSQTQNFYHFFFDKQDTLNEWITESQKFQAYATRMMTESFRRDPRMITFAIHLFIDAFPSGWMKTIMDCNRNPKKAYFEYKNALEPILLSLRTDKFAYFSGEKISIENWICNDTQYQGDDYTLSYELLDKDEVVACSNSKATLKNVDVSYNGTIEYVIPKVDKRKVYTLKAFLFKGKELITYNTIDFDVYPSCEISNEIIVKNINNITTNDLDKVNDGAVLFIDKPTAGEYTILNDKIEVKESGMSPIHFASRKTSHKWIKEFTPYDFRMFYSSETDSIKPLADCTFSSSSFNEVLVSRNMNDNGDWIPTMLLGEKSHGKGKIIVSEISYNQMIENPAGKMLLNNIK